MTYFCSSAMVDLTHCPLDRLLPTLTSIENNNGIVNPSVTSHLIVICCQYFSADYLIELDFKKSSQFTNSQTLVTYGMKMTRHTDNTIYKGTCVVCETVVEMRYWFSRYLDKTPKKVVAVRNGRQKIQDVDVVICPRLYLDSLNEKNFFRTIFTTPWLKSTCTVSTLFSYVLTPRVSESIDFQCFNVLVPRTLPTVTYLYFVTNEPFLGRHWNFTEELRQDCDSGCSNCNTTKNLLRLSCHHLICQECLTRKFTNCSMMMFESCIVCRRSIYNSHIIRLVDKHPCRKTLFDRQNELVKKLRGRTLYFDFDTPQNKTHTQQVLIQLLQTLHGNCSLSPFADLPDFVHYGEIDNVVVYQTFFPPTPVLNKIVNCFSYHRSKPVNFFILYTDSSFKREWKIIIEKCKLME